MERAEKKTLLISPRLIVLSITRATPRVYLIAVKATITLTNGCIQSL